MGQYLLIITQVPLETDDKLPESLILVHTKLLRRMVETHGRSQFVEETEENKDINRALTWCLLLPSTALP